MSERTDMHGSPIDVEDESFLDDVFDIITTRLEEGEIVDVEELAAPRPHLLARIADMMRLAVEVSILAPIGMPTYEGYEIVRELGRGGMGSVYLAKQSALASRLVALKVLPHGAALSTQARARFRNEALALARIRHPNVIEVYEVLDLESLPAYAMEWVDGRSLLEITDHLAGLGARTQVVDIEAFLGAGLGAASPARVIARWGWQIASALVAVHEEGLLHRDVKPSNIMVRRDGTALLTDFGLVRGESEAALHTRTGAFLGTPAYAAPEQLRGETVDPRSDVYGLGATLYHALAFVVPYPRVAQADILRLIEGGLCRPLRRCNARVPRDLATIVETAMESDANRRYSSAAALREDLDRFL
ncbi:MAG: serine/threonine protein kinase, partial [Planctomycetes bacterium]|nr:serine/threonine protein kinase [Planctomycetota bacterium]